MAQQTGKRKNDDGVETRERIKRAARRLFAEHGIEAVSVRQILAAAGQRHVGAVAYYFSSKEALVEEILADAARIVDDHRNAVLDEMEARGVVPTVRDIVALIIQSSIAPCESEDEAYERFFAVFTARNRNVFVRVVLNRLDIGFKRCVRHLRLLLPDLPRAVLNERIICMMLAVGNNLAAREAALEGDTEADKVIGARILRSDHFLESLTDFCLGGLMAGTDTRTGARSTVIA